MANIDGKRKTGLDKYDYIKYEVTKRKDSMYVFMN